MENQEFKIMDSQDVKNDSQTNDYRYDVAFSFLAQDESLATQINDLLQDRFKTFLYSKKQGEIAGTDGEKTFNLVFGEQSRLVVVLYREGWGQTPWTRIEETAIRNRAFEHGYDFVKFIPVEDKSSMPRWLPRTYLWIGLKRWGVAGAASVIEERIEELGGEPHDESVQERSARLGRSIDFENRREQFLQSHDGAMAARKQFDELRLELERLLASITETATSFTMHLKVAPQLIVILGLRHGLSVTPVNIYREDLRKRQLQLAVTLWDGHPPFRGIISVLEPPKKLQTINFTFDLLPTGQVGWVFDGPNRHTYATNDLASFILKYYMDDAQNGQRTK